LARQLGLRRWIEGRGWRAQRREQYFQALDLVVVTLRDLADGEDPPALAISSGLRWMLERDRSLESFLLERDAALNLTDDAQWERIWIVAGGTIYESYVKDCEDGKWP
jgi:hypothetical protein